MEVIKHVQIEFLFFRYLALIQLKDKNIMKIKSLGALIKKCVPLIISWKTWGTVAEMVLMSFM